MADVHKSIRSALETQLGNVSGNPQIAYEGVSFVPTTGTSYLQVVFAPVSRRPAVRGLNPQQRYDGLFSINCYAPEGHGPAVADTLAKNVINAFEATTSLTSNNINVSIDYAERQQGFLDSPWYFVPVSIGWYAYT